MRLRNSIKGSSDMIAGSSGGYEEPTDRHRMDDFDSLLTAFDGFIRGRTDGASTDRSQPRFEHFDSNSRTHQLPAKTDGGARLPRLYSRSSSVLSADLGSQRRPGTRKNDRRTSRTKASPASPSAVNILTPHPALEERILYGLHDDPMDLMLRSRGKRRSGLGDLQIRPGSAGLNNNAAPFGGGSSAAIAGVFRLTHAATGYVHYGYSWDIGGAKAEQLRRLGFESGDSFSSNSTDLHPHRGLSAIVCGHKENNLGGRGDLEGTTRKNLRGSAEAAMGPICFEVVRRVSLPTRFRAVDFDNYLRKACQQELLDRRTHLLVLVARQYKITYVGPVFRHMLVTCRREGENETFAAAAEIQRTWRGFHSRDFAQRARENRDRDRVETERERVGGILATWAQAKHRGNLGRRRACSLREEKTSGAAVRKRQASANAAVAVQRWIRSVFRRWKEAAAAADKAVLDALLEAIRLEEERRDSPPTGETLQRNIRGPPRPISASEAGVACDADTEVSLSGASERSSGMPPNTAVQERTPGRSNGQQQQKHRRPSSPRRGSDVLLKDNGKPRQEPLSSREREGKRPSSAPRSTQKTGDTKSVERARPATPELPDASRLVLEGDPKFTSATAIQAAWRGFFARLSIRKRRRAAAALRRKREGKWRKQRGVVGKRVAVAWDERRDMEEGGEGGGAGGKASCTEIQRIWRGALGRKVARLLRRRKHDEIQASIEIQRTYRGLLGKREARSVKDSRNKTVAAALMAILFLRNLNARRRRRYRAATIIQCIARGLASRRRFQRLQCLHDEHAAARKVQMVARGWLGRRQGRQRNVLAKFGACALCCARLAEMYLETTEQELCLECYRTTGTVLESRKVPPAHSEGAFELLEHRKRQKAATLTQRAWLRFQRRASARFGSCEVCPRWKGPGAPLPRAARAVCVAGCDSRRHLRYCRRCCAIAHSLRATVGHEIRSVDRYGTEMAAVATLGGAMWRYIIKLRFLNLLACYRKHLHSSATLVQSRWRCYHCRRVFTALRRGFLYVEAAARSVERYWFIRSSREDIIANIAGFMTYNVQAFPPGIHPPPSGRFALWERLIVDAVRARAVTKIQLEWRKKMERAVARALAHVARLQMIERQRLRALAELHASVDIQRAWRGSKGRRAAYRRAATIRFAQRTAERYANPDRFAVANLRAFNAHGGFLGAAGVDARSLLAAAVGVGEEGQDAMTAGGGGVRSRESRKVGGFGDGGKGIWLRLSPYGEDDWGLSADTRVAGIAEVCIRVSLTRCISLSSVGGMLPPLGAVGGGAGSEIARFEKDGKVFSGRIRYEDSRDAPPLTLKLELISVQIDSSYPNQISPSEDMHVRASAAEYGTDDDDSSLATSDSGSGEDSASRRGSRSRGGSINSYSVGTGTGTSGSTKTTSDHSGESDDEDSEWSGGTGRTATGTHASRVGNTIKDSTKERRTDGRRSRGRYLENDDYVAEREQGQYQCDVEWCGVNVGGTRAQLAGLPTPRWEGQVFYLPLCAAATFSHGRTSESTADTDTTVDESWAPEHASRGRTGEGGARQQQSNPSPSLLKITLNRISCGSGGPASCTGGKQDRRVDVGITTAQHRTQWSAFLCGLIQPSPVGRAVLEAGDILSMLGSQQVVGMNPPSRCGAAGSSRRKEREDGGASVVGWSLRLLLSLENTESTRTRLLVTDVLGGIIQDILDAIPGQVPRIEIRVVGTRAVPTPNAANITSCGLSSRQHRQQPGVTASGAPRHHEPPLHLCAEWNGNHAAFMKLSPCEDGPMVVDEVLFPDSQNSIGESFDDDDFGTSSECPAQARAAAKSNMIVLPVYVPWIMKDASDDNHSEVLSHRRRPRRSTGGGNVDGDDSYEGDEGGGRSHCLRVMVGTEVQPGRERRKLDMLGHGSHHNGVTGPTTSSSSAGCTFASSQQQTEVCFFERDLLRYDWTEILVPVFRICPEENARDLVRRPTKQKRCRCHPQANRVVVLRVRSAGFQPKPPPLWLVRRDFAERAVKRIISAAAAAIVQPRVELTLVGLCGAVESLLSECVDTQGEGGVEHATPRAESLCPSNDRGNSGDSSCGEILCEAFWNGALVHRLRLRRAVRSSTPRIAESKATTFPAFHPEGALPIGADDQGDVKHSSSRSAAATTASKSRSSDPNQVELVDPDGVGLDQPVGGSKPRGADPSTWFSDGGDEMLSNDWVSLGGGVLASPRPSSAQEEASSHKQQETFGASHGNGLGEDEGHREGSPSSSKRLGEGGEGGSTHALRWIPVEGDAYTGRPFRLSLPACLVDNAGGSETGGHRPEVGDKLDREAGNEGWSEPDRDNAHGASLNETEHGDGGEKVRGDLRLVFWSISTPSSTEPASSSAVDDVASRVVGRAVDDSPNDVSSDAEGSTAMVVKARANAKSMGRAGPGGGTGVVAEAAAVRRGRGRRREKTRRFLGWASLVDDELLLQPPGQRVELALSAKAGLDTPTAWSLIHHLKRKVTAYRATQASVVAVVRHFDVPRGPLLGLQCPAPFFQVEVIDGHGLPKDPGQLSVNPYVVLTLDGEPFARSSTSRGATFPVWSSEVFMVQLPPPPPGAWHLTAHHYFQGYRGKPFTLGARVYSQVGPQAAAAVIQKGVLNGGVGEGDVLLGEARVPFSLLKEVPFHYLPLRLQPPHPPQPSRCGCCSGVENASTARRTGEGGDCGADFGSTRNCTSSGGPYWSETSVLQGDVVPDSGLLGIGVRIVFPSPTVPDVPCASSASDESSSDLPPPAGAVSDAAREAATGGAEAMGDAIVLSVYEAEALVEETRQGEGNKTPSPCCVVLVNGLEVGRTTTIPNSSEPMWATDFRLPDSLLRVTNPPRGASKTADSGGGGRLRPPQPPSRRVDRVSGALTLEVWNRVPEGDPVLLGAVEVPPDLLQEVISSPAPADKDERRVGGEDQGTAGEIEGCSPRLHSIDLNLQSLVKHTERRQLAETGHDESSMVDTVAAKLPAATEAYGGTGGVLSLSLRRVFTTVTPNTSNVPKVPDAIAESPGLPAKENESDPEAKVPGTRISETALQRYRSKKLKSLADSTRAAREKLDEARALLADAGSASRGRSANDCAKENAARFVRVWERETSRAERAQLLEAKRSTPELGQEKRISLSREAKRRAALRRKDPKPPTHDHRTITVAPDEVHDSPQHRKAHPVGKDDVDVPSPAGDRNKQLVEGCKEDDQQGTHEEHDRREDVELDGGEHDEEGEEEEEEEEEPSALATILPRLPAAQKEVFVKVEGVFGLSGPFRATGNSVYARIFWNGEEVARTSSVTPSQQAPLHQPALAATAPAAYVHSIPGRGSDSNDSVKKVDVLAGGENFADKVRDAAGTAAASVANATAAAVHASGGGGVGGTMEGHWEQESFVLPLPHGDGASGDNEAGKSVDLETADGLLGSNVQGAGDGGGDTVGGDSTSASLDDGIHLRVEVWQGKHCHGQVELEGTELLRMCKKVQNATPGGRSAFIAESGDGRIRLPDHFPHFLPNPEARPSAFRPYKLALVPREDDGHYRESSAAAPARLTLTLLALEPGQVVAAQAQLAVALEDTGSRIFRQQQDECADAGNGTLDPGGRGDDNTAKEGARAKATGVAEDLVNVLCARRSPLCFRVQPLVIHINSFDDDSNTRWTGAGGSGLFLVAKRQVLAAAPEKSSYPGSDGKSGASPTATASSSAAGAQGDLSIVRRHGAGDRSHNDNRRVVEEEELGRTALFGIHSGTTIVPGTSFTIPPSALVADVKRLSRNGSGGATSSIPDVRSEDQSEVRVVLEIVQGGDTGGGRGSVVPGGQRLPFLKKRATATRDSTSEKGEGGGARVVARATLDAGFLRRTIGCQRSVGMTTVAPSVGETSDAKHSKGEDGQSPTRSPFARLDVAGHVVSARPGRPRLRLQVQECQNLRSADMLGKSDPCVLVFWNGVEVGRTQIARDDLHPVFSAAGSTFRLPLLPPPTSNTLHSGDGRSGPSCLQRSVDWRAYAPELRLEVWDMDRDTFRRKWKKGQLLGSVDLRGPYGIAPLIEAFAVQDPGVCTTAHVDSKIPGVFLRLRAPDGQGSKHGAAGGEAGQAFAGVMSIRISIENDTDDSEAWISQAPAASTSSPATIREARATKVGAVATNTSELKRSRPAQSSLSSGDTTLTVEAGRKASLGIRCLDARGLPAGSDGYCRVFWNGRQVGSTLSASRFAQETRHTTGLGHAAPASVYQRNPVWWTSSDEMLPDDDRGYRKPSLDEWSSATAVVPQNESPTVVDELMLEVFDGSTREEGKKSTGGMLACRPSLGESVAGKDAADLKAGGIGVGVNSATTPCRDVFGRSLGIVTIHGEHLTSPPHGRIDLPLLLPPSCKGVNESGITLSISLKQIVDGKSFADVAVPRHMSAAEQRKSNDNVPTTTRSITTNTMLVAKGEGGEPESLKEQTTSQRPTRWLRLLLQGARLRRGLDVSGTSDPFCTIYVDRVWFAETRVCWGTLAPRWDQRIEIEVFGKEGALAQGLGLVGHEIRVEVWDKDVFGANDFIGEVHLFLRERQDGMVEVRTRAEVRPTRQDAMNISQADGKAGLQYHALELCREGEKEAPTTGKPGDEPIGTLSCATVLYTEKNWKAEIANMSLPWVLGASVSSLVGSEEDCIVIQLVGAVLKAKKQLPHATPGSGCFALLRWGGSIVGKTPVCRDLHEPTWHEQIFAVQMDRRVSDNVLDIDIYVADTDTSAPAEGASAPPEDALVARCRLEGPFTSSRFPDFTSSHPLLCLGDAERAAQTVPDPDRPVRKNEARPRRSWPKKKRNSSVVGSVSLRIGITAATLSTCGGGIGKATDAVGDEDAPEVSRRRTNTVDRRLRMHVGWVSLARMLGRVPNSSSPTKEARENSGGSATHDERTSAQQPSRGSSLTRTRPSIQSRQNHLIVGGSPASAKQPSSNSGSVATVPSSPLTLASPTSGVFCVVIWCGVRVASFEICPSTGLPLTPGECLLELPRGAPWNCCRLVLEVIATEQFMQHPRMEEARDIWHHIRLLHSPTDKGRDGDLGGPDDGAHHLLGRVVVGWQALKTMEEQAYRFTTCPEDAVAEEEGSEGGDKGYTDLQCSLCVSTDEGSNRPAHPKNDGICGDSGDEDHPQFTFCPESGGMRESRAWRILPARIAMSVRLERLMPSRIPRPSRVPEVAPRNSVCRLRLSILGGGRSTRTSHPGSLRHGPSLSDSSTVTVGWNGCDRAVGPPLEWQIQVPPLCGNFAPTSGLSKDILLDIPRDSRSDLSLTLREVATPLGTHTGESTEQGTGAVAMLGSVTIDWDGLSCLAASSTDYFVEPPDGQLTSSKSMHPLQPSMVNLEFVAPTRAAGVHDHKQEGGPTTPGESQVTRENRHSNNGPIARCYQTTGFRIRVNLQLELSPASVPHLLSFSPVAARGPTAILSGAGATQAEGGRLPVDGISVGDFRDPCRKERLPYLRFSWPWDDGWLALTKRRSTLIPRKSWRLGSRRAVTWAEQARIKQIGPKGLSEGIVSGRLPLTLSGLDGSVSWPGSQELRTVREDRNLLATSTDSTTYRRSSSHPVQQHAPVLFVEAYDMGLYAPLEHQAAKTVQRLWRRALDALRSAREWWEYYATMDRHNAATCIQKYFRGWRACRRVRVYKVEVALRGAAAAAIQRRWRCSRARRRAEELRTEGLRKLKELELLEKEREAKKLELRRAGLSVLVARGAGLLGEPSMDLSGLSDPFCVALWNGQEVGRTPVRHGTRDPDWVADGSKGGFTSVRSTRGGGWFNLSFLVPETERWGEQAWPPMCLEIRCYDHDLLGPADLIGCVKLSADAILAMASTANVDDDASAEVTWLELMPDTNTSTTAASSESGITKHRNPFRSLGDIAVAVNTKLPLPGSLEEYERSKERSATEITRGIADVGVLALLQSMDRELCMRDRGLWVVNASGLVKADFFGKSDPYAKVFWDGREIGATAVRHKTLNPVWFTEPAPIRQRKATGGAAAQEEDKPYFWLEGTRSTNPRLRVELYDWDAVGSHDFLGGVELDMAELVELQRLTLGKARANGGNTDQQMLLKTEYPLRPSGDPKVGGNGTLGLCLYLDLEQKKRRQKREQAVAARRQQAIDLALAEVDMKNEALERTLMSAEDADALDMEQLQRQRNEEEASSWQIYYDESTEPPSPWWFNSVTGESTWDCPNVQVETDAATDGSSLIVNDEGERRRRSATTATRRGGGKCERLANVLRRGVCRRADTVVVQLRHRGVHVGLPYGFDSCCCELDKRRRSQRRRAEGAAHGARYR
ncbi:unnamed protein product [Ectocarpus sp. 6 AP-2014]